MNLAQVARVLAGFALFFALVQLVPLALALGEAPLGGIDPQLGLGGSVVLGLLAAGLLWFAGRKAAPDFFRKEGIAAVGLAWVLATLLGALPYHWSGALPHPADAVFEAASGLTSTGASVFGSGGNPAVADLPPSLLLWRALTQWLGGLGIILVFVALLPAMGITSRSLLVSEQGGVAPEGFQPRMLAQARVLLLTYLTLSLLCVLLLRYAGGLGWFDATCHAATTLSTGGFSTRNGSVGEFGSIAVELILVLFMFLGGCNFALLAAVAREGPLAPAGLLRSPEFRCYAAITAVVVLVAAAALVATGRSPGDSLRASLFNVVSVYTSTGYATEDFQRWPQVVLVLLIGCMVVGASAGSTAGGLKTFRFLIALKLIAYTVRHYVRPRSVERLKMGSEVLAPAAISAALGLIVMWFAALLVGTAVMAMDPRLPFLSALSTAATTLGCCGPALCPIDSTGGVIGPDLGPMGGFGALQALSKLVLCLLMLLGRLEFLVPLALLAPGFWRR